MSKTGARIIRELATSPAKSITIRQIAKNVGRDYNIIYRSIQELAKQNIIKKERAGHSDLCCLSPTIPIDFLVYAENMRSEDFLEKHKSIKIALNDILEKTQLPFFTIIVFGSYAKGTYTSRSDLDLLFIIPDRKFEKELEGAISFAQTVNAIKIHDIILTFDEFQSALTEKGRNVPKEVLEKNVVLYGSEAFYKMLR